jgi:hypothetical protein
MEVSNKVFHKDMLTGIDSAVKKQTEETQSLLEMMKVAFPQAKK